MLLEDYWILFKILFLSVCWHFTYDCCTYSHKWGWSLFFFLLCCTFPLCRFRSWSCVERLCRRGMGWDVRPQEVAAPAFKCRRFSELHEAVCTWNALCFSCPSVHLKGSMLERVLQRPFHRLYPEANAEVLCPKNEVLAQFFLPFI